MFASLCVAAMLRMGPAAETGGRPAIKAAKQESAKNMVNADTVLSFTPRTGLISS
jgi:hypothetical protein